MENEEQPPRLPAPVPTALGPLLLQRTGALHFVKEKDESPGRPLLLMLVPMPMTAWRVLEATVVCGVPLLRALLLSKPMLMSRRVEEAEVRGPEKRISSLGPQSAGACTWPQPAAPTSSPLPPESTFKKAARSSWR